MNSLLDEWLVRNRLLELDAFAAETARLRSIRLTSEPLRVRARRLLSKAGRSLVHIAKFSDGTIRGACTHVLVARNETAAVERDLHSRADQELNE